jgi:pimeloyl-ACP methyl ester carboxylesterase
MAAAMSAIRTRIAFGPAERLLAATAACVAASLAACAQRQPVPGSPGTTQDVVFTQYSPLSRSEEIARRTLPPLTFRRGQEMFSAKGKKLREQQIDLANESFAVYLPTGGPPKDGYGLLVFVSAGAAAVHPKRWRPALDRHSLIFVSAANSGNETSLLDRRLPLAVLAYENVRARYPIDAKRVYVGGLSGGSRVAEIAALAFPDVFRGALLNAGSEPIGGEAGIYLPPADLFRKFQETRLVYATGEKDEPNLARDYTSQRSMREFCVLDMEVLTPREMWHQALDSDSLYRALDALDQRSPPDPEKLAQCNARLQRELAASVSQAEAAIARADRDDARGRIKEIDAHYGGLAAPAIFDLDAKITAQR